VGRADEALWWRSFSTQRSAIAAELCRRKRERGAAAGRPSLEVEFGRIMPLGSIAKQGGEPQLDRPLFVERRTARPVRIAQQKPSSAMELHRRVQGRGSCATPVPLHHHERPRAARGCQTPKGPKRLASKSSDLDPFSVRAIQDSNLWPLAPEDGGSPPRVGPPLRNSLQSFARPRRAGSGSTAKLRPVLLLCCAPSEW
jgi:hypothetical protein